MDVDAMRHSMTPEQMDKWIAFDRMCPIGRWHETAMICATLANLLRPASEDVPSDAVTIDEFLPDCLREDE